MNCPVCGRKIKFEEGIYCSPECEKAAEKEIEELLERMDMEEEQEDCRHEV